LRRKVSGKTKTEVKDKLRELHSDLDAGVQTSASYTVDQAVADWMREGRDGLSPSTLAAFRCMRCGHTTCVARCPI
jgi:Fe-S-cluster-containing dehydrogenase component